MTARAYSTPPGVTPRPGGRELPHRMTKGMREFLWQIHEWHAVNGLENWFAPKNIPAPECHRAAERLGGLAKRGYVERVHKKDPTFREKPVYKYRITGQGLAALARETPLDKGPLGR